MKVQFDVRGINVTATALNGHDEARDQTLGVTSLGVRTALRKQIEERQAKQLVSRIKSARQPPILTALWLRGGVTELISLRTIKRVTILLIGSTVLAIGVVLLVLPGPAFVVIPAGLAILAIEFAWARRWLRKARNMLPDANSTGGSSSFVVRHVKNFLEWASARTHENIRGQTERKDKNDETRKQRESGVTG